MDRLSFRTDPYLWIHFAGWGALPLCLLGAWLGLAAGGPVLPGAAELWAIAAVGALPWLWLQWQRPFDIFSVLVLAVKPEELTQQQRQILRAFKRPSQRLLALLATGLLLWGFWQLVRWAPLAAGVLPVGHWTGVAIAAIAFLLANLFAQVPLSAAGVLLTSEQTLAALEPYPVEHIARDFFVPGLRVKRVLPFTIAEPVASAPIASSEVAADNAFETDAFETDNFETDDETEAAAPAVSVATEVETDGEEEATDAPVAAEPPAAAGEPDAPESAVADEPSPEIPPVSERGSDAAASSGASDEAIADETPEVPPEAWAPVENDEDDW